MRIAQIAPPFISVPPKNYGGTEFVIHALTEELVKRGHDVTLFASADSQTSAKLVSSFNQPLTPKNTASLFSPLAYKLFWMHSLPALMHVQSVFEHAKDFDIIHDHTHYLGIFFSRFIKTPMVSTYHGSLQWASRSPIEKMILKKYKKHSWVAISENQKKMSSIDLNFASVIHHGIDPDNFSFNEKSKDYLVWLGRITKQKGIIEAITASKQTNKKLIIAGIINPRDQDFFETEVKPHIDGKQIEYIGSVDFEKKVELLKNAKALLYPITWEEPFGLVMIEAMACGTPVVAYNHGAVPEIVDNNTTGYVINVENNLQGLEELCKAVNKLYMLPLSEYTQMRKNSRLRVENHFTIKNMTDKYEDVYKNLYKDKQ